MKFVCKRILSLKADNMLMKQNWILHWQQKQEQQAMTYDDN